MRINVDPFDTVAVVLIFLFGGVAGGVLMLLLTASTLCK